MNTRIQVIPLFLKMDSSESLIPNEDDHNYKFRNVTLLKGKQLYIIQTKRKLDLIKKYAVTSKATTPTNKNKPANTYNRERATSTDSSYLQNCQTTNERVAIHKISIKRKLHELLDTFKVCERFLSFLTITDVVSFIRIFNHQISSSAFTFLIKRHAEAQLLAVIISTGCCDGRKKGALGVNCKAKHSHYQLLFFGVNYYLANPSL